MRCLHSFFHTKASKSVVCFTLTACPSSVLLHFPGSVATCGWWLPYGIAQVQTLGVPSPAPALHSAPLGWEAENGNLDTVRLSWGDLGRSWERGVVNRLQGASQARQLITGKGGRKLCLLNLNLRSFLLNSR